MTKFVLLLALAIFTSPIVGAAERKALPAAEKEEVTKVLEKNDELFNAFLKKDAALVESKAKELLALVKKGKANALKTVRSSAESLNAIKAGKDNEANLEAYEKFLNPLIQVVKGNDVGKSYNIFSCPMVQKSWIQDTRVNKGVKNVYAMEMLECGTQDTRF